MADALMDKPNALVGLELAKLEKMHNGQEYFFTGFLTSGVVVVLRRAEGVSPAGRELWQLSLGRRKHAGAARPSGRAPRKAEPMQFIVRKRHLTPREPKPAPKPAPSLLDRIRPSRSPFKRDNDADRDYLETEQERKKRDRSKDRQCLRCGLTFRSTWTGHRTCDPCKAVDARRNPSTLDE